MNGPDPRELFEVLARLGFRRDVLRAPTILAGGVYSWPLINPTKLTAFGDPRRCWIASETDPTVSDVLGLPAEGTTVGE
jgi:hypothetical protein